MVGEIWGSIKTCLDITSGALAIGTLVQSLPVIAAALSIAWSVIRICEWLYKKYKLYNRKRAE